MPSWRASRSSTSSMSLCLARERWGMCKLRVLYAELTTVLCSEPPKLPSLNPRLARPPTELQRINIASGQICLRPLPLLSRLERVHPRTPTRRRVIRERTWCGRRSEDLPCRMERDNRERRPLEPELLRKSRRPMQQPVAARPSARVSRAANLHVSQLAALTASQVKPMRTSRRIARIWISARLSPRMAMAASPVRAE